MEDKDMITQNAIAALMDHDVGSGMEGADRDSYAIPFIRCLQQLSPQVTVGKSSYIPAARPGAMFNTVTNELYESIIFIPCAFQRKFIQWGPRGADGGYKGEHNPEDIAARLATGELIRGDDGKLYVGEANPKKSDYLSDTRNHYGLILADSGPQSVLLSLSSTQIKKSKQLMAILAAVKIRGKTPPTWMNKIRITTTQESNDSGSWWGIRVEHAGFITDAATYEAGKAFHDLIMAGRASAAYETEDSSDRSDKF